VGDLDSREFTMTIAGTYLKAMDGPIHPEHSEEEFIILSHINRQIRRVYWEYEAAKTIMVVHLHALNHFLANILLPVVGNNLPEFQGQINVVLSNKKGCIHSVNVEPLLRLMNAAGRKQWLPVAASNIMEEIELFRVSKADRYLHHTLWLDKSTLLSKRKRWEVYKNLFVNYYAKKQKEIKH
jgi:hypothetical protein